MKSTAVDESLSSMNQQLCSRENQILQRLQQNEKSTQIEDLIDMGNLIHKILPKQTGLDKILHIIGRCLKALTYQ